MTRFMAKGICLRNNPACSVMKSTPCSACSSITSKSKLMSILGTLPSRRETVS